MLEMLCPFLMHFIMGFLYWIVLTLLGVWQLALVYLLMFQILDKYQELPVPSEIKNIKALKRTTEMVAGGEGRVLARRGKRFWISRKHKKLWAGLVILLIAVAADGYFSETPLVHQPWAIGHRGCLYEPENTIAAVESRQFWG